MNQLSDLRKIQFTAPTIVNYIEQKHENGKILQFIIIHDQGIQQIISVVIAVQRSYLTSPLRS